MPLFFLAWKTVSRTFFLKTVCTVFAVFLHGCNSQHGAPVVSDKLVCCLIGGAVSGFGVGLTLKCGS
ncbi:MAG: YitT family protein [Coprococcus phoceensis]